MSGKRSVFLDVDSKILEKNLLLQEDGSNELADFENFLKSQNLPKDDAPWKLVTPKPGLCAKTTDSKGNKIFVNICVIDEIPEPKELTEEELMELWQSEDATDFRIPLSLQEPHDELDKAGKPSVVYDVAINTKFFKKLENSLIYRGFVMQVALEGIEKKFDIEVNKEGYVVLQNRKSVGELRPHRIRLQKGPYQPPKRLIEEVANSSTHSGTGDFVSLKSATSANNASQTVPKYRLIQRPEGVLEGEFYLPNIVHFKDISLDVGEDRMVLECRRGGYLLDIFIPLCISEEDSTALFNKDSKILTVKMPVKTAAG